MAGQRGKENYILNVDTGTGTPTWTPLEQIQVGLNFNNTSDLVDVTTLSNTSNYKEYLAGDSDFEISGSFNIIPSAPAQAKILSAIAPAGNRKIKIQWAETKKAGDPLYSADVFVGSGNTTVDDPMTKSFSFKLAGTITTTTQA